jgi:hypothetical protein
MDDIPVHLYTIKSWLMTNTTDWFCHFDPDMRKLQTAVLKIPKTRKGLIISGQCFIS